LCLCSGGECSGYYLLAAAAAKGRQKRGAAYKVRIFLVFFAFLLDLRRGL
jgi:hypothetical protein